MSLLPNLANATVTGCPVAAAPGVSDAVRGWIPRRRIHLSHGHSRGITSDRRLDAGTKEGRAHRHGLRPDQHATGRDVPVLEPELVNRGRNGGLVTGQDPIVKGIRLLSPMGGQPWGRHWAAIDPLSDRCSCPVMRLAGRQPGEEGVQSTEIHVCHNQVGWLSGGDARQPGQQSALRSVVPAAKPLVDSIKGGPFRDTNERAVNGASVPDHGRLGDHLT